MRRRTFLAGLGALIGRLAWPSIAHARHQAPVNTSLPTITIT